MCQHLLWCLMSVHSGALSPRVVHPTSPVLLTKNGPLESVHSYACVQQSNTRLLTHLKFENRWRLKGAPWSLIIRFTSWNWGPDSAILRETSAGTSYQKVRLVFRPHAQVRRSICTSEPLRASTRVSSGFALLMHSSPSFGSDPARSYSNPSGEASGSVDGAPARAPTGVCFHCA